jgi:energy-coupling factor transporter ATP-binding protein EcfA2
LIRILSEYPTAVRQPLKDHPLATFIRKGWPAQVYELLEHAKLASNIQCGGTKFIGNWASVPWIGIRHDTLAPSFMAGTYCVYLFSEDGANAVLSLGQGVVKDEPGISAENLEALFREVPPPKGFTVGRLDPAVLASTGGSLAKQYANATLLHRVYARNSMPDEEHLSEALFAIVRYLHTLASSPKAIQLLRPGFMFVKDEPPVAPRGSTVQPTYNIDQCIEDTGFAKEDLQSWMAKLRRKKHLAIQGPPGTGKTFLARHLARLVVSDTNGLIETIQFHPSYSYEDFVQGFRPEVLDGQLVYDLRPGRFLDFCMEAQRVAPSPAVLIIDEMNRGNLSRIFGELLYLLEYRDQSVPLSQGKELFSVPSNVLLIGTMNTADRSIALVDHALRRRFSFVFLGPDYELLARRLKQWGLNPKDLVETLERINRTIGDRNYHIGTSFFLTPRRAIKAQLSEIWEGEIEPYLDEYFFDQLSKVEPFRWKNVGPKILAGWAEPEPDDQHARVDS